MPAGEKAALKKNGGFLPLSDVVIKAQQRVSDLFVQACNKDFI